MTLNLLRVPRRDAARSDMLERQLRRYDSRFQGAVRALAARHSRIADLAASFPGLLFALAVPRPGFDPARALTRVIDGHALVDVAAAAGVPTWLRKLPPETFACPIPRLPDGELFRRQIANHLPQVPRLAPGWLQIVAGIAEVAHEPAAVWIAREFLREPKRVIPGRLRLVGLWAWFSGQPETFGHELIDKPWTPDIRIGPAFAAADVWLTNIQLHVSLARRPIADMWLEPARAAGYDFVPLSTIAAISEEATAMKNCVRTYGYSLALNCSRLWSVRRDGERVATLEVGCCHGDPLPNIIELKGVANAEVPRELWWVARQWLHAHDLPQIDMGRLGRKTEPLDRATWRSLWRPYWLAKHCIPKWLPLAPSRRALNGL